jgi:uncharacterized membrane protein
MIDGYLDSLSAELRVPRRVRVRIVAETRDHLHESVAAGRSQGEAMEAFGQPRELAARFHEQLASAGAKRAGTHTALLMAAFLIACGAAVFGRGNNFPFGIVVFLGGQLALVAAALGAARTLRYRDSVPASRLADMYRANGLAVACVTVVSLAELLDAGSSTALAISSALLLAASLGAGVSVARSRARARVVPAEAPADDALDDLLALVRRLPASALAVGAVRSTLRAHPWRFCLLFAAASGLVLAAQHNIAEGGVAVAWRPLLAGFVIASIEAAAVIACFAAFGRFLGFRRD